MNKKNIDRKRQKKRRAFEVTERNAHFRSPAFFGFFDRQKSIKIVKKSTSNSKK